MTGETDLAAFRAEARAWLGAHLERRAPGQERYARGLTHRTVEDIAAQRARQRQL
ncbi:MAG: hypothetical protein JWL64_100, partial [Frankiales bacterium]|nr:hypothetical protein [Frankiales bacterium]